MISVEEAQKLILDALVAIGTESVALETSLGRTLAGPISADRDYPPFNRVMMDGFAVRAQECASPPADGFPSAGTIVAGDNPADFLPTGLPPGRVVRIMTGCPLPTGADSVIKIEDCEFPHGPEGPVRFTSDCTKGQNVAPIGEDVAAGGVLAEVGTPIDAALMSTLATVGVTQPMVYKQPRVSLISTGNEIVAAAETPQPHQIRDSNLYALRGLLGQLHIVPHTASFAGDSTEELQAACSPALEQSDIVILTGGVSMGDKDLVPAVLAGLGVHQVFHKVAIKPGKPMWFGTGPGSCRVFALPGNPFSAIVDFKVFVEPYILGLMSRRQRGPWPVTAGFARRKKGGRTDYLPAVLRADGALKAELQPFRGSGDIRATLGADGLVIHGADAGDIELNQQISFLPFF